MAQWYTFFAIAPFWILFTRRYLPLYAVAILTASLYFCLHMFYHTGKEDYAPDSWGHVEYLRYLRDHWTIPPPHKGWQFYQAPLYYVSAGLFGGAGKLLGIKYIIAARHFSILCVLAFQFYGMRTIHKAIDDIRIAVPAAVLFAFWPLVMSLTGRIGNEVLLYPLWAASIYYLFCWYRENRTRDLCIALMLCAIMLLVKISAIVPLFTIGAVVLHKSLYNRTGQLRTLLQSKYIWLSVACIAIAFSAMLGRTLYYKYTQEPQLGLIIGNIYQDGAFNAIKADNSFDAFFTLDTLSVMNEPFWNIFDDKTGRQNFWISYTKSMNFGFFTWHDPSLAIMMNIGLLGIFGYVALTFMFRMHSDNCTFFFLCIITIVGTQLVNRLMNQTYVTHDARMTFPVIICIIAYIGSHLEYLMKRNFRSPKLIAGYTLLSAQALMAVCFAFNS